jgi:hypothetical protein
MIGVFVGNLAAAKASKGDQHADKTAMAGSTVGAGAGVMLYLSLIENRAAYKEWVALKMDGIINSETILKYSEDVVLSTFICPISQMVALVPIRTPNGHLFDLTHLELIPKDQKGQTPCPMRGDPFNIAALSLDAETALVINKRLLCLIEQDIAYAGNDPEIKKTLESQANLVKASIKTNYFKCLTEFDYRMANGVTKASECAVERAEFIECFGDSPDMGLNWDGINWKAVLDKRWLKLHPRTIVLDQ